MTALELPLVARGKVREVYDAGDDRLLLVASDRISAYDHVLPTPVPDKGRVLTQLSVWWFDQLTPVLASFGATHHLLSASDVPAAVAGRAMLVRRLEMLPVECVARGYLSGSGTAEYQRTGSIRDVPLPAGLVEGSQLPEPVFTPSTKAEQGAHDEAIDFAAVVAAVGQQRAEELRGLTLALRDLLEAFGIPVIAIRGYEADDVIGTLAQTAADRGLQAVIVSGDKDFYQLVGPGIALLNPGRGGPAAVDEVWVDESNAAERLGVPPSQVVDFLALVGDSSDNIPGVKGIG